MLLYLIEAHVTKLLEQYKRKENAPEEGRGLPKCFHNGIILIVNCYKISTAKVAKHFDCSNSFTENLYICAQKNKQNEYHEEYFRT